MTEDLPENCTGNDTQTEDTERVSNGDFPTVQSSVQEFDATFDVRVTAQTVVGFDTSTPAQIRLEFTNVSDTTRIFLFGQTAPVDNFYGEREDSGTSLVLTPVDEINRGGLVVTNEEGEKVNLPARSNDSCWRLPGTIVGDDIAKRVELSPCESVSETYSVYAPVDSNDCLSEGRYQFVQSSYDESRDLNIEWTVLIELI